MKPKQRQSAIIDYLNRCGESQVTALASYFSTTGATIRKDLTALENSGAVVRRYGAVMPATESNGCLTDYKSHIYPDRKLSIAEAAAQMIEEGDSLIIDAGSTVLQLTHFLGRLQNLTIMTASLLVLNELARQDNGHTILMPGGTYRKNLSSFQGQLTISVFEQCNFDKLFLGADGVDLDAGVTTFCEAYKVTTAMCKAAQQIILLIDSSKFGRKSPNIVCSLDKLHTIITDDGISPDVHSVLIKRGINVVIVNQ